MFADVLTSTNALDKRGFLAPNVHPFPLRELSSEKVKKDGRYLVLSLPGTFAAAQ